MEPIFTLCHAEEWTPEKVILYVSNTNRVEQFDHITSDVIHGTEYSVHGVTLLTGNCLDIDVYKATHRVSVYRHNPPNFFGDLPLVGTTFYRISSAPGKFTTQDDIRSFRNSLNINTLREIIVGIIDLSHGQHFIVKCTEEQRRQLSASIIEDAKSSGLVIGDDFQSRDHFEFIQWWTGLTVTFQVDDYFLVQQIKIREHSVITRDINHTDESVVTRIGTDGHVYVKRLTQFAKDDPYQGAEHKWDGPFLVANY